MRFSESEMEGWGESQVHRWLKVIGFPYPLDLSGEDLVEAKNKAGDIETIMQAHK